MADHDPKMRQAVVLVDDDGNKETISVALAASDIEIGAVEIKNSTDDTRAIVTARGLQVEPAGAVASGATDSGNPVKVGARYNSTAPVLTDGQRVDVQATVSGKMLSAVGGSATAADGLSNVINYFFAAGDTSNVAGSRPTGVSNFVLNGSTWDRVTKGNATSRLLSAANTTNSTSVKGSAGNLHKITGYNAATDLRYLKFYNKATAPTVGSDTPVLTLALPALTAFDIDFGAFGTYFSLGIGYGITTAAADASSAAPTAGDVTCLNVIYS